MSIMDQETVQYSWLCSHSSTTARHSENHPPGRRPGSRGGAEGGDQAAADPGGRLLDTGRGQIIDITYHAYTSSKSVLIISLSMPSSKQLFPAGLLLL